MVDPFCEVVLYDYNNNLDIARDPEVLYAVSTMVNRLGVSIIIENRKIKILIYVCVLIF